MIKFYKNRRNGGGNPLLSFLLVFLLAFLPKSVSAQSYDMANLCYSISGGKATVTGYNPNAISYTNTKITIPTNTLFGTNDVPVVAIGANAFKNVNTQFFKEIVIQEGVKTIGESAFASMQELLKVSLPSTITSIGNNAFSGCRYVETITIAAKTAPTLGGGDLSGYGGVKIYIPFGTLSSYQSKWGTSYTYVEAAPGAGEEFTSGDFKYRVNEDGTTATIIGYTGNATELTLGGNVTCNGQSYKVTKTDGTIFTENNTLTTATIANGITEIGYGLFEKAAALKTVTVPASVTTIGSHVFDNCQKLESVTIEKNSKLTSIGEEAFFGCSSLKEFTILCTTPSTLGKDALKQLSTDYKIYVPSSAVETYKTAEGWSAYADHIHAAPLQVGDQFTANNFKYQVESIEPTKTVSIIGYTTSEYSVTINPTVTFENEEYTITKVGDNAFTNVDLVYLKTNSISEVGTNAFNHIYVPFGSGLDFKNSEVWSSYKDKIKEEEYNEGGLVYTNISDESTKKVCVDIETLLYENSGTVPQTITVNNVVYKVTKISGSSSIEVAYDPIITLPAGIEEIDENVFQYVRSFAVPHTALSYYQGKWDYHSDKFTIAYSEAKQLTDATNIADAEGYYETGTLTYNRTFDEAGQYATLCLPFDTNLSELTSAFETVYVPQGNIIHYTGDADAALSGKFILLLEKQGATGTIAAGQPFFVKTKADAQEVTLQNASETELTADAAPTITSMKVLDWDGKTGLMTSNNDIQVSYAGTYKTEEPNGRYTFNTDGSFGIQTEGSIIPFRMQLTVTDNGNTQNAPMFFSIGTGDNATTGINQIIGSSNTSASTAKVYSIDGRLINTTVSTQGLAKGVYVKNGKKFIIK